MLRLQRRFIKLNHAGEQKRVAFEQLHVVAFAIAPAVEKCFGFFVPKFFADEIDKFFSAAARYFSSPKTTDARANAPSIRPFHDARILSSRCGRMRLARAASIFVFADSSRRLVACTARRIHDAQNILSRQRLRMAVVNEIAFLRDAKIFCRDVEFLDRQAVWKVRPSSSNKIFPRGLRCRRPRRNKIRRRDASCRAKHNPECRATMSA